VVFSAESVIGTSYPAARKTRDACFDAMDILTRASRPPNDEAIAARQDFGQVPRPVEQDGPAAFMARLKARRVMKDGDTSFAGAAGEGDTAC
jgi:hypothetical protein